MLNLYINIITEYINKYILNKGEWMNELHLVAEEMIAEKAVRLLELGVDVTDWTSDYLLECAVNHTDREIKECMIFIARRMDILGWDYCAPDCEQYYTA